MTVLVLGDQLTRSHGPVAARPDEPLLMIEAADFARKLPYHPHKLTLVFAAMRHFRDACRDAGRSVEYYRTSTFEAALTNHFDAHPEDDLVVMRPPSHGATARLRELIESMGGTLTVADNDLFLCDRDEFRAWIADREPPYRHEQFYRYMRRKTGYLVVDGEPVGGAWNYDEENREPAPEDYDPPEPPRFEPDAITEEVCEWVAREFTGDYDDQPYGGDWADPEAFRWPVTRDQARELLDHFVEHRLAAFGPYQDAMLDGEWAMHHSLLSSSLNLGLLHPREVVELVIDRAREADNVPRNSVEGFVRQVIGWREFLRGIYVEQMPDLEAANQLGASEHLPDFYWTGETDMACLADVVDGVRKRGYSHHIERLMILANFGLIYGVEPRRLNRWFHAAYVDAYHWVTTPNVVEMGLYGSGVFATKPYASSANYVNRMSDYCGDCPYYHTKTTSENACPFNALYWDFLDRNEELLRDNHRMGLVYSHLDDKDRDALRERAREVRRLAESDAL
jgi:deoxyribodipyrimidine photolyase-related protein